jgi:checkpoint serine/threonine-protein kinase
MDEVVAAYFVSELLRTLAALHSCGIVHGDVKPDNIVLRSGSRYALVASAVYIFFVQVFDSGGIAASLPRTANTTEPVLMAGLTRSVFPSHLFPLLISLSRVSCPFIQLQGVQLVDFNRALDTHLYAPGTCFVGNGGTDAYRCVEMQTGRPWVFQVLSLSYSLNESRSHGCWRHRLIRLGFVILRMRCCMAGGWMLPP